MDLRLYVNHQVAATDQVHSQERRVLNHVVLGKRHAFANSLLDLVRAVPLYEKARQALLVDIGGDALRVNRFARSFEGVDVDVGGEHLQA